MSESIVDCYNSFCPYLKIAYTTTESQNCRAESRFVPKAKKKISLNAFKIAKPETEKQLA